MSKADVGWSIRPYQPGDDEQLVALFGRVFGRPRSIAHWHWKLAGRGDPTENVWVAVTHQDRRIVGQYGGIPLKLKLGGQTYSAVHAVEAMTDPDFRKQGMLTSLGSAAHAAWAQMGNVAVLGLPNEQWGTRNSALGYHGLFPLAWLRFPLDAGRVLARQGVLPRGVRTPVSKLGTLGSRVWRTASKMTRPDPSSANMELIEAQAAAPFDDIHRRLAGDYPNMVVRDNSWVGWRFLDAPELGYKVLVAREDGINCGYIAYRLMDTPGRSNGYIADLFTGREDLAAASVLIKAALDDLLARGAGMVLATAVPGSALYGTLRRNGFLPTPRRTAFTFEMVPLASAVDLAELSEPKTWHLTGGDFDII